MAKNEPIVTKIKRVLLVEEEDTQWRDKREPSGVLGLFSVTIGAVVT